MPLVSSPVILYPDNIRRDLRHTQGRMLRTAHHEIIEPIRPMVQSAASQARQWLASSQKHPIVAPDRAAAWISSNPLAATGLALGAGVLIAAALRSRSPQSNG